VHGDPIGNIDPSGLLIAASFSVGQLMTALTFASQVVTAGSAIANAHGAAQSFTNMVNSLHTGRFVEAVINQLAFIGQSAGFALDVFSFLALSKVKMPGGGAPGMASLQLAGAVGGNLAIRGTIGATIAVNIRLITHVITPIYAAGHMGILAMSARQNGPWWQGQSSWQNDVASQGNWEWQRPFGNPSNVDPDLPRFDGDTTFGFLEALGARANIRSGNSARNVNWFKQQHNWASLSDDAKTAARHAEGAGVAAMQRLGLKEGVVRVNANYVCQFCRRGLPELLKEGEKLYVFYDGPGFYEITRAGAKFVN
jgi:hypothetical protein